MKKITSIIVFILLSLKVFAGGPWPQAKAKGYFKLSQWWIVFDQHYTDQGLIDPNVTMGLFNTTLYAEYGLGNNFTAIVNAPLFSRSYTNNLVSQTNNEILIAGEALNGFGDIDLALKYSFGNAFPVSATILLGLPAGTAKGGTQGNLQTGDGEFNQMLRLDVGTGGSLGMTKWYTAGYGAINNRTQQFSDEIRAGAEVGIGIKGGKAWLNARLDIVESLKNGATAETATSSSVFANNSEFISLGIEASVYVTQRFGVSAGVAGALRGEIIAAAPSYSVGIFLDLSK